MNTNQIAKAFLKANTSYINGANFSDLIKKAVIAKVSFRDLINVSAVAANYSQVVKSLPVGLPFGNIIFEIHDYPMTSMETGAITTDPFAIHLMPCAVTFNEHNLVTMIATDIRLRRKEVLSRSYILYADLSGVHVMTAVDRACEAGGCVCFKQNVFNTDPGLALQFLERIPGFSADCGFALPDCAGLKPGCAPINANKSEMSTLIKLLLAYSNLPTNFFVKVTNKRGKSSEQYHIISDDTQWKRLVNGEEKAELYGNSFTDGSNLLQMLKASVVQAPTERVTVNNKTYTAITKGEDDEARTITEDSEKSNGGDQPPVGSDISKNAS